MAIILHALSLYDIPDKLQSPVISKGKGQKKYSVTYIFPFNHSFALVILGCVCACAHACVHVFGGCMDADTTFAKKSQCLANSRGEQVQSMTTTHNSPFIHKSVTVKITVDVLSQTEAVLGCPQIRSGSK